MTSTYFNETTNRVSTGALVRSSQINNLRDDVGTGFDQLPEPADLKQNKATLSTESGSANAYVLTTSYTLTAFSLGQELVFIPGNTNTGPSTLNPDTLGTKAILRPDGSALQAGDLTAGNIYVVRYNGTAYQLVGFSDAAASAAAAAASAAAAADSESAAALSETNASDSADAAAASALEAAALAGDALTDIVDDLTPQAGGEFDFQAHSAGFTLNSQTGTGAVTLDLRTGNKIFFTFGTGNVTFTFTAPSKPCTITLWLKQDSVGSRTVTWPVSVKWPAGLAPVLSTGVNAIDMVSLTYDGTNYYGNYGAGNYS